MSSTFLGLSITSRGLNAAQIGLATTTNNMSNIDTDGYSRQVVSQTSIGPAAVYSSSNLVGAGVEVTSVDQVRSFRLDQKYWQQNSTASKWEAKSSYLEELESNIFNSTSTSGISAALSTFSTDLETLATDTSDTSARAVVLADAENFCTTLNEASNSLTNLRNDINSDVKTTVDQINSYATQIAAMNKQIAVATASGASTNELEDQRGLLVDELSGLVSISVSKSDDGILDITVAGGATLVNGNKANSLECTTGSDGMYDISWESSGDTFDAVNAGGALSGYMELRDGDTASNQGIPYYIAQLDSFAQTFAQAFNEGVTTSDGTSYSGHVDGVGIDDDATSGIRFFTYSEDGEAVSSATLSTAITTNGEATAYQKITAANISVSSDIQEDTNKIATASSTGGDGNNENINDIISICEDVSIPPDNATLTNSYSTIVSTIGTASSFAQEQYERKSTMATYIDTSRSSVSGVSSDEETINLTTYQSAYAASASMASTWSEIYQTTINMVDE